MEGPGQISFIIYLTIQTELETMRCTSYLCIVSFESLGKPPGDNFQKISSHNVVQLALAVSVLHEPMLESQR